MVSSSAIKVRPDPLHAIDCACIIIGQGLAGTALAWHLQWLGQRVLVIDPAESVTSSRIAAGLVNPVTGRRVNPSWRAAEFLPVARAFYARTAQALGQDFYHDAVHLRVLHEPEETARWHARRHGAEFAPWVRPVDPPLAAADFHPAPDAFEIHGGGWLDTRGWLRASADWFAARDSLLTATVSPEAVSPGPDGVTLTLPDGTRRAAATVVFCQGHAAAANPWFPWIRWKSAKGEILHLTIPGVTETRILHRGGWLLPLTEPGAFRAGSTYEWSTLDHEPTDAAREKIEGRLRTLVRHPWQVTSHQAAVRPVIRDSRAFLGRHPVHPGLAFFNGLGSKGVLHAPFFAAMLAENLTYGSPVEPEVDIARNE